MSMPALQSDLHTQHSEMTGPFQLLQRLGGGGFAEVFLARDRRPHNRGGHVAVKRLRPGLIHRDPVFLDSLLFEAELGMMLSDSHVVRVDSVFEYGGEPMIVMEYIEGFRLDRLVAAAGPRGLPAEAASEIVRQVCEGLVAIHNAHDAGGNPLRVVHQDIKPGNVIVTRRGVVKILDLGMARPQRREVTPLWVRQGTPGYRSPEQARGETMLSAATDLYAVGIVLFELLTGRRLFVDAKLDPERQLERQRQLSIQLELVASKVAPPGLDLILQRLLAFEAKERYSNAYEVIKDLAHWQWTWNQQFDLTDYLSYVAPRLDEVPHDELEPAHIHRCDTEPGTRLDSSSGEVAMPYDASPDDESGVELPSGTGVGAVEFASFDEPARVQRASTPPEPARRAGRDLSPGPLASARHLIRRLAAPFASR